MLRETNADYHSFPRLHYGDQVVEIVQKYVVFFVFFKAHLHLAAAVKLFFFHFSSEMDGLQHAGSVSAAATPAHSFTLAPVISSRQPQRSRWRWWAGHELFHPTVERWRWGWSSRGRYKTYFPSTLHDARAR